MIIVMKDIEDQFKSAVETKLAEVLSTKDVVSQLVGELLVPKKSEYGRGTEESLVKQSLRLAVKAAVHSAVNAFIAEKEPEIKAEVNRLMMEYLKPEEIANTVVGELTQVSVRVIPFPAPSGKKGRKSTDEDED